MSSNFVDLESPRFIHSSFSISDVRMNEGKFEYLVKFKKGFENGEPFGVYSSTRAKFLWPKMLASFLETQIVYTLPERTVRFDTSNMHQTENPTGEPLEVSCTCKYILNFKFHIFFSLF